MKWRRGRRLVGVIERPKVDPAEKLRRIHVIVAGHASLLGSIATTLEGLRQETRELRRVVDDVRAGQREMGCGMAAMESDFVAVRRHLRIAEPFEQEVADE